MTSHNFELSYSTLYALAWNYCSASKIWLTSVLPYLWVKKVMSDISPFHDVLWTTRGWSRTVNLIEYRLNRSQFALGRYPRICLHNWEKLWKISLTLVWLPVEIRTRNLKNGAGVLMWDMSSFRPLNRCIRYVYTVREQEPRTGRRFLSIQVQCVLGESKLIYLNEVQVFIIFVLFFNMDMVMLVLMRNELGNYSHFSVGYLLTTSLHIHHLKLAYFFSKT
jgi:hypothetical protein